MIRYRIKVNMQAERERYETIEFTSGDKKGYCLELSFYSNGERYDPSGCALAVKSKRADGAVVVDAGYIEGKCACYDVADNAYAVPGDLKMEAALAGPDGSIVTTAVICARVREGFGDAGLASASNEPILAKLEAEALRTQSALNAHMTDENAHAEVFKQKRQDINAYIDRLQVPSLINAYGMTEAFKIFAEANGEADTLTNITERFFTAAAKTVTQTYASEFYKFNTSNSTLGTKKQDNEGLVCEPSTNAEAGRDDYANLPLFACFDCNYTIDAETLEPVIHAIKDVYGEFSSAPTDSLVGVIQMTGWVRRTSTETTKTVEYRAIETEGFRPLPEGVRAIDNSVRPYVIHAKYAAGLDSAGQLSSVSGVQPATNRPGSTGSASIGHDGQIALWRKRGNQYGGFALCDIAFYQLMLELKYAVLGNAQVMRGCRSYTVSYQAAVSESGVKRILLTEAQAGSFVVGSYVSVGTSNDRSAATCYDVCDIVKIAAIEDVQVEETQYKAIVLDTNEGFDTEAGTTYITTQPWRTGSTDAVKGNDGSPTDNTSDKEPFKIQGIELMLGMYEAPMDTTCQEDAEGKYTIFTNRKAENCAAGGTGTEPVTVGTVAKEEPAGWKYVAELNWDANDQEAYMLSTQYGGASSTGYRAAYYINAGSAVGWREWLAFGHLSFGDGGGLACANLTAALDGAFWYAGARAGGTGSNRGVYTPNAE